MAFLPGLFSQQLEHLEKSSQPAGLVKAGPALLEPGLDGNSAVIRIIFFTYCHRKGTPLLFCFFFFNLNEDTIKSKYAAGVFNKNMMEENIQSLIIRRNLRCEQRCVIPTLHPLGCALCGTGFGAGDFRPMAKIMKSSELRDSLKNILGKKNICQRVCCKSHISCLTLENVNKD